MFEFYWQWISKAFRHSISRVDGIAFFLGIFIPFLIRYYPGMEQKLQALIWQIPLSIFVIIVIVRLLLAPYWLYKEKQQEIINLKEQFEQLYKEKQQEITSLKTELDQIRKEIKMFATPDELTASHLKGLTIRIADLVREDIVIRNKVFENCYIYGPATIFPIGKGRFLENVFDTNLDSIFIITNQKNLVGVIGVENCSFINCHFQRIAFIGPETLKQKIMEGMTSH
jgi:hypothetical protein